MDMDTDEPSTRRSKRNKTINGGRSSYEDRGSSGEDEESSVSDSSTSSYSYLDGEDNNGDADNPIFDLPPDVSLEDDNDVPADEDTKLPSIPPSPSKYVGKEQQFTDGNGTSCIAILISENGVPMKTYHNGIKKRERGKKYLCGGHLCGCDCCPKDEPAYGANKWTITDISTGSTKTIYTCALFAPLMGLKSNAGNLVGKIVTNKNIEEDEPPEIIATNFIGIDNKSSATGEIPLMGGDSGLVPEAADIGLKYYIHDMGSIENSDNWLKDKEKNGGNYLGTNHGLFFQVSDNRGGKNMSSNYAVDSKFWDMMKDNVKSHEQLQEFIEIYEQSNNVSATWLVMYLEDQEKKELEEKKSNEDKEKSGDNEGKEKSGDNEGKRKRKRQKRKKRGGEKGSNKKSMRKSGSQNGRRKKKRWGRHKPHPDGQYCGMARAILSFSCYRKIMRLEDRETGRWFDMLVQIGSIVEMNRRIGGVSDKRWWHSVRGAEGSYTLIIEFSPKKKN